MVPWTEKPLALRFTLGGVTFALHGDVEMPTGCCVLFVGGRVEYGAIWSDILQRQNDTDTQMAPGLRRSCL